MEYYWEIIERDGTVTSVSPASVDIVKRRLAANEVLTFADKTIPSREVVKFRKTNRPFTTMPLLESAAQAFHDPLYTDNGIKARWVKKEVTEDEWNRTYSQSLGYKRLDSTDGMVLVAFRLAVHDIDQRNTPYCTDEEVSKLSS